MLAQTAPAKAWWDRVWSGYTVTTGPVSVEGLVVGEETPCQVVLQNSGTFPVKIVGISKSCTCVLADDVAFASIPPGETLRVSLGVRPKRPGSFHQRLVFFLDSPQQYVVAADILGSVQENER